MKSNLQYILEVYLSLGIFVAAFLGVGASVYNSFITQQIVLNVLNK